MLTEAYHILHLVKNQISFISNNKNNFKIVLNYFLKVVVKEEQPFGLFTQFRKSCTVFHAKEKKSTLFSERIISSEEIFFKKH